MSSSTSGDPFGERGSLSAQDSNRTRFLGSASGVHFSKTVFSAFAPSIGGSFDQIFLAQDDGDDDDTESMASPGFFQGSPATDDPSLGYGITGEVDPVSDTALSNPRARRALSSRIPQRVVRLDRLPEKPQAIRFARNYFRSWHVLFPFVDGKTFLHNLEALYQCQATTGPDGSVRSNVNTLSHSETHPVTFNATLRVVLSLGQALDTDVARGRDHHHQQQQQQQQQQQPPFADALRGSTDAASYIPSILATARVDSVSAIQAVLSLQLYLLSTFRLRAAHQFGGIALRLALDAGLHRCPGRFHIFANSPLLVQMRKRIWHSALSLDRFISQQLGLPLGISESDHDVCPLGEPDAHTPPEGPSAHRRTLSKATDVAHASVADSPPTNKAQSRKAESTADGAPPDDTVFPQGGLESSCPSPRVQPTDTAYRPRRSSSGGNGDASSSSNTRFPQQNVGPLQPPPPPPPAPSSAPNTPQLPPPAAQRPGVQDHHRKSLRREEEQHRKECFAQHFTIVQQFNARAADLFNKSAAKRSIDPNSVMKLRSDVERWWNAFSSEPQVMEEPGNHQISTFLKLCYLTANIGLERPMLALVPGTPAFSVAIQSAIRASRDLITTIDQEFTLRNSSSHSVPLLTVRWPGFLSATYQAALVLAYSTKVGELPVRLVSESLSKAIKVIEEFGGLWRVARPYASAVQVLHREITRGTNGSRPSAEEPPSKKRRQSTNASVQSFFGGGGIRTLAPANEVFAASPSGQGNEDMNRGGYSTYGPDGARRQFSASPAASTYASSTYSAYQHPTTRPYGDLNDRSSARPPAHSPSTRPDDYRGGNMAAPGITGSNASSNSQNLPSHLHAWPSSGRLSFADGVGRAGGNENFGMGDTYHGQAASETSEFSGILPAADFDYGSASLGDDTWTSILSQVEAFLPPLRN